MLNVAMPIAHETAANNYAGYNIGGNSVFEVVNHFDRNGCTGVCLRRNPATPMVVVDSIWDLYAFCDGFISLQGNDLVLRLPRELIAAAVSAHNSGSQYLDLEPHGPQLRHVRYRFDAAPGLSVETQVRAILGDAAHPGRTISHVIPPAPAAGPAPAPQQLGAFLAANPANLNAVVTEFMAGSTSLFVRAGDVIGNFAAHTIDIAFLDSCGSKNPLVNAGSPIVPGGRPANPSYHLFVVGTAANAARVNMLTDLPAPILPGNPLHPLEELFSIAATPAATGNFDQVLDRSATTPPKPRHPTIDATVGPNTIAGRGYPIGALGDVHQSRNAPDPFNTQAPVRWRCVGTQAGDAAADKGKLHTELVAGRANLLPAPAPFDHTHAPGAIHTSRISTYWTRYASIFTVVGEAFDVPCELLLSIACKETSTGGWFDANFANTHEMDVVRLEPLNNSVNAITAVPATRAILNNYVQLAGGNAAVVGAPHDNGANANIPRPWNNATAVAAGNPLTWGQLRDIADSFPRNVRVSPGVMQSLIGTARGDLDWLEEIYGATAVSSLSITNNGVNIDADAPPATTADVLEDWFGVCVDAAGANTTVAANVHTGNSQMKRAFHNIIAGAAHMRRNYHTSAQGRRARFNLITDYDFPTLASGFNDGAEQLNAAAPGSTDDQKWRRLYLLKFYGSTYPSEGTKFYNAAIALFNALPAGTTQPSRRLWHP